MQTQQRINKLTRERDDRQTQLQQLSSQLLAAEETYRRTRHEADGRKVLDLDGRVRLAELACEGVLRDLQQAAHPQPVAVTGSRESLLERRRQIVGSMEFRERQRQEQIAHYTNGTPPERWNQNMKATLRNMQLEPPSFGFRREAQRDAELLAHIDAQLAALDDREADEETDNEGEHDLA